MKKYLVVGILFILSACSTSDKQIAESIKKNPQIVFDTIEDNPEKFIEVINRAARKAQEGQQQKQMADIKQQQEDQLKNPIQPALSKERLLWGSDEAEITIVEYADFQCPACRVAYENLQPIKKKYGNRVKFYYKNMPLNMHPMAMPAAFYYEAITKQDKAIALKFYDLVFQNQGRLRDETFLSESAKKLGVDMKRLKVALKSKEVQELVQNDMAEFEKFGFTGTPVIVVNGVALHGAQPASEIERVIELTANSQKN